MKRRLLGIFICVLSVFLMSHNSSAIDLVSSDVYIVRGNFRSQLMTMTWTCYNDASCPSWNGGVYYYSISSFGANLNDLYISIPSQQYVSGDWIQTDLYLNFSRNTSANHSQFLGMAYAGNNPVDLVDQSLEQLTDNSAVVHLYFRVWNTFTDSNLYFTGVSGSNTIIQLQSSANTSGTAPSVRSGITTVWHEKNPTNYTSTINNIGSKVDNLNSSVNNVNNSVNDLNDTISEQNDKENAAIDNIDNQSTSDIGGTEDSNTTSLIGLFSSFVSALSSASATNCNINGDMGNIDLGTLNLCRDNPPAIVQIIGSIFLIAIFVPLAYFLVKRIISEVRSFTNG